MEEFKDEYVKVCPYCGGSEMIEAVQYYGVLSKNSNPFSSGTPLYCSVCRRCGSVLRKYVKEPEKLLKKEDRRQ